MSEQCCPGNQECSSEWALCSNNNNKCEHCGGESEQCCPGDKCKNNYGCKEGTCTKLQECNEFYRMGGNEGTVALVNLGKIKGKTTVYFNSLNVPDSLSIRSADNTQSFLNAECIGTASVDLSESLGNCNPDGTICNANMGTEDQIGCVNKIGSPYRKCGFHGWTCFPATGVCHRDFDFSDGPNVIVDVTPNCAGTTQTLWEFKIACP